MTCPDDPGPGPASTTAPAPAPATVTTFGQLPDGREVRCYALGAGPGLVLRVLDLGGSVHGLEVTGRDGRRRDVVLGHPTVADRLASTSYLGSTIGRYANRIAHGRFVLDGRPVMLETNDRGNSLHGGPTGFDLHLWEVLEATATRLRLRMTSPEWDMGFPGAVTVTATYEVGADTVGIRMEALCDAPTVVNLTHHSYFNLDGEGSGSTDQHELLVHADRYIPVDGIGIPLGSLDDVAGTPFDLRTPTRLGPVVRSAHPQLAAVAGIDHTYVVDGSGMRPVAALSSAHSGIRLEVSSDQPGLQVYTGNHFNGTQPARDGGYHHQGDGVALEPQLFPDTPNHPEWPSARLEPGQTYLAELAWRFVTT